MSGAVSPALLPELAVGNLAALRAFLSGWGTRGTSLTAQLDARLDTEKQDTLLTWAARHGQAEGVRLLIEAGASVGATTGGGASALHIACQEGHVECVQLLREAGAAVNQANDDGRTPLYAACLNGHLECVRLLLEASAAVNQANVNGFTPLYMACGKGHLEIAQLLLEVGAAVGQAMNNGATPLLIACQEGHLEVAKLLSSYGASRAATPFGTPEEVANRHGHADLAAWLVASRGWTPLAHLETLTAARALSLLRSGASLHEGEPTPLQRAVGGEGEAAALIRRAAAPWSPARHSLFPAVVREYAVTVMRIGYQIALSPPDAAEARPDWSALSDVWREHVLPHAVAR